MKCVTSFFIGLCIAHLIIAQSPVQVLDIDGNIYQTIKIGDQVWMAENLKTTQYRDGSPIPEIGYASVWTQLDAQQKQGFAWFNYDDVYKNPYGAYYNVHAIKTEKLCPFGWIVPTKDDWDVLIDSLGDDQVVGGWLKAVGNLTAQDGLWQAPNLAAIDSFDFKSIPSGVISTSGTSAQKNRIAYYWSSSVGNTSTRAIFLKHDQANILRNNFSNGFGFSVRCLKE